MKTRFHEIRIEVGWSMEWIAGHLDIGLTTVRGWNAGKRPVNARVMAWLERHAARMAADPFPEGFGPVEDGHDGA
jgi:hypothetical protein